MGLSQSNPVILPASEARTLCSGQNRYKGILIIALVATSILLGAVALTLSVRTSLKSLAKIVGIVAGASLITAAALGLIFRQKDSAPAVMLPEEEGPIPDEVTDFAIPSGMVDLLKSPVICDPLSPIEEEPSQPREDEESSVEASQKREVAAPTEVRVDGSAVPGELQKSMSAGLEQFFTFTEERDPFALEAGKWHSEPVKLQLEEDVYDVAKKKVYENYTISIQNTSSGWNIKVYYSGIRSCTPVTSIRKKPNCAENLWQYNIGTKATEVWSRCGFTTKQLARMLLLKKFFKSEEAVKPKERPETVEPLETPEKPKKMSKKLRETPEGFRTPSAPRKITIKEPADVQMKESGIVILDKGGKYYWVNAAGGLESVSLDAVVKKAKGS